MFFVNSYWTFLCYYFIPATSSVFCRGWCNSCIKGFLYKGSSRNSEKIEFMQTVNSMATHVKRFSIQTILPSFFCTVKAWIQIFAFKMLPLLHDHFLYELRIALNAKSCVIPWRWGNKASYSDWSKLGRGKVKQHAHERLYWHVILIQGDKF